MSFVRCISCLNNIPFNVVVNKKVSFITILLVYIGCTVIPMVGISQISFQHTYSQPDSGSSVFIQDAKQTPDGGYVITGLTSVQSSTQNYRPFIAKLNCKGKKEWEKSFGNTQSQANVNGRVIISSDSNVVMIHNLGSYQNYSGLVVKLNLSGNMVWQKEVNLSSGSDVLNDIKETPTGEFILTGGAQTVSDVCLVKLSSSGDLLWSKTFGNTGEYDDGYAVITTSDGGYLVTGRYISMGTFQALLLKTDSSGTLQWLRCYGDSNQHMVGFDLKEAPGGGYYIGGSTTLLKPNFQSFGDNFLLKVNAIGDTLWTKIFYGTPDLFENISSIAIDSTENIWVSVATASYPGTGFVPNKHGVMKFTPTGNLVFARLYNAGSSHYPRLSLLPDQTVLLSGYTNKYSSPIGFHGILMKMNTNAETGCFESDVLSLTVVSSKGFKISQPIPVMNSGGTVLNQSTLNTLTLLDSVLCESYPLLTAAFTLPEGCAGYPLNFQSNAVGAITYYWDFNDGSTAMQANPVHTFTAPGNYAITLRVQNGCEEDSITQTISIQNPIVLNLGSDTVLCDGEVIQLISPSSEGSLLWNTGSTTASIPVSQAGWYWLEIEKEGCGVHRDSIFINGMNCATPACDLWIPTAFSPNGDGINDKLVVKYNLLQEITDYYMEVRNRWGQVVFTSRQLDDIWDGNFKQQPAGIDTYYYFVRYRCGKTNWVKRGDVLLLRN